jgi:ATP-dependent Clp protease ATP-binding subunit ClpA
MRPNLKVAPHGYGPSMQGALCRSLKHADALAHPNIEPEHLVLGLLDEAHGGAARVLRHFGVDAATTRRHIIERII